MRERRWDTVEVEQNKQQQFQLAEVNAAFDAVNYNTDWLAEDFGQDLVSEVSTWSFITWAALWKDHWFAHAAGWHWPEASDHLLGSAGLIIYPVAYCLRCTASLHSRPPVHTAQPLLSCFTMQRQDTEWFHPPHNKKNDAGSLSHLIQSAKCTVCNFCCLGVSQSKQLHDRLWEVAWCHGSSVFIVKQLLLLLPLLIFQKH